MAGDAHYEGLQKTIRPILLLYGHNYEFGFFSIKINPQNVNQTIATVQRHWENMYPNDPFDYFFLDEQINRFYQEDNRLLQAISVFALTAILIACMGLFGLSMYMVEQRTKEVGIRKVLGATVAGITIMLTKYFMRLMLIASLISFPLAWWAINNWLRDFAYRVYPGVGVFMIASFAASTIALFAVAFQAIRAAKANPVISLRSE